MRCLPATDQNLTVTGSFPSKPMSTTDPKPTITGYSMKANFSARADEYAYELQWLPPDRNGRKGWLAMGKENAHEILYSSGT